MDESDLQRDEVAIIKVFVKNFFLFRLSLMFSIYLYIDISIYRYIYI